MRQILMYKFVHSNGAASIRRTKLVAEKNAPERMSDVPVSCASRLVGYKFLKRLCP